MQLKTKDEQETAGGGNYQTRDELYEAAVDIVVRERRGSVSLLQRALGIGYGRAARLIDFMAEAGVVGQYNGAQAREVLITLEDWEARTGEAASAAGHDTGIGQQSVDESAPARLPQRRNKIRPDGAATSVAVEPETDDEYEDDDTEDEYEEVDDGETEEEVDEEEQLDDSDADYEEDDEDDEDEWEEVDEEQADEELWDDETEEGDEEEIEEPVQATPRRR
jgi:S-DNA-T family DNA segregation ATPase FtsK/SpoIIIE